MRKFLILFYILLISVCVHAVPVRDVTTMGDVWVITIDQSRSMKSGERTPYSMSSEVKKRMHSSKVFEAVDFEHDRFLFLLSGYSYDKNKGAGNEWRAAPAFDKSLIHPTDNILHTFTNKDELIAHTAKIIETGKYNYMMSFVSQLRTFSIIHAVNYLKRMGESDNFDNLFVLTITDDADQNDQWRIDYRELKRAAPNKIRETNDSITKYIYNKLDGTGGGELYERYSDDKNMPHIWLYEYKTCTQLEPLSSQKILSIRATDGKTVLLQKHRNTYNGNDIYFYHIDSVAINDAKFFIDTSFETSIIGEFSYDNKIKHNNVSLWGWFQVKYNDPIYGPHYKIVPFEQHERVISTSLAQFRNTTLSLLSFIFLGFLVYWFVIRPRKCLLTIYSGTGSKMKVRRGFQKDWKGEIIPLQCYVSELGKVVESVDKMHKNVRTFKAMNIEGCENEVLICSHRPLYFSQDVVAISTDVNIKDVYYIRQKSYSDLLKSVYESSYISRVYDNYKSRYNKHVRRLLRGIISIINFLDQRYYYLIQDVTQVKDIYIAHGGFYDEKRFLIEHSRSMGQVIKTTNDGLIILTLKEYFSCSNTTPSDIVLSVVKFAEKTFWNILDMQGQNMGISSLCKVRLLSHFVQEGTKDIETSTAEVERYLKHTYKKADIGRYVFSLTEEEVESRWNDVERYSGVFSVFKPTAPAFISFVEDANEPKSQVLYSPLKDQDITEKPVTIKRKYKDGLLFLSLIPMEKLSQNHPLARRLSNHLVMVSSNYASKLLIRKSGVEMGNINTKYF